MALRGAGGRRGSGALAELLAGRAKRRRCAPERGPGLRDAAVRLLSCHQNLSDLFLEVENSNKSTEQSSTEPPGVVSEPFVVSALQEQASRLGVPLGILSAKTAVANVEQISQASLESGQTVLLNGEQRKKLSSLLETIKDLSMCSAFCRSLFCQEMWKMQSPPVLEVVWHLHRGNTVNLGELLESNSDTPAVVEWLCSSLCLLCELAEDSSQETELCRHMLSDFVITFLQNGFQQTADQGKKLELKKSPQICFAVLQRMLTWVLDAIAKEKQEDTTKLQGVKCWLNIFNVTMYRSTVCPDALHQFFIHTLTEVLTYNPLLKVSDAIHMQREWSFARTTPLLTTLYRKLFVAFSAEELLSHLQQVLETHEVNWQHVLSCVSTLVICQVKAEQLVKDLLSRLLTKAFENYDMENIITAFLIVRQAALEGPAVFMPYAEWFKASFGNSSGYHGNSKKALVFLFEFLSELVPFEAPQYLKVHIMHPPFVPAKYRSFLSEYIALAKTRLADLKVSIEDMGLYEDLSTKEIVQPQCQALQDVEKAIQIFENTGKIPTSVMEASIFRRPYYISRFIPALLKPRVLPEIPDSCMALIDSLKRANKIPPNVYSRYIQDCQAMKKKLVQDGSIEMETDHLKEPLEQLKAELAELRTLVTDQSKYSAVRAQIAVISERLSAVLGCGEDENQAASLNSRVQVNVPDPRIEAPYQNVVDLLLTSFCQNLIAASYFNPPDRQGHCPSLFVKMICGHRDLLPALLTRLCQLIYYQGPSLNEAHVLGLAAFVVHLWECKSFVPEVDVGSLAPQPASARGLSVTEFCDRLLACRTGESLAFCLRFCTAAVSYCLCKFSSLPHGDLCSFLPPGLLKKLQYVVPRLNLEARGPGREEEEVELSWRFLSCPSVSYTKASLCLWKQTHFQELLKEKVFQLSFREWLLFELEIQPETDVLSASERQDFHYWALYEWYLPASSASGGCDGDLEEACGILIDAFLDFCQRSELDSCGPLKKSAFSTHSSTANPDILSKLQEMVLELEDRKAVSAGRLQGREHFLFRVFQARLAGIGNGSAVDQQLRRQQELLLQKRILLGLPPPILITTCRRGKRVTLDCEGFFHFVNSELRNVCSRGCALSYDIAAHFFRGLLSASLDCEESTQGVNDVLAACRTKCPLLLCSAGRWWPRLEPVLCCQWTRLSGARFPQEMQRLKECRCSATSFLSSEAAFSLPDAPWISAAFLHFAIQQQVAHEGRSEVLRRLGSSAEQLLVSLLFFSLLDVISTRLAPQEEVDAREALEWCLEILRHLEEQGMSWLVLFQAVDRGHGPYHVLRRAASDQYIRLLPLAFFSLIPSFHQELFVREPSFLAVVVDSYIQLLRLFVDGGNAPGSDQEAQSVHAANPVDSLEPITKARRFLLHSIPRCPRKSFTNVHQFLDLCEEFDPEMTAALLHYSKPAADLEYHDGPDLF
ncbi:Fanconi anemia group A protein isoform X2 [Alligator mississippiensis]|uniref:Fanconi anemia group A protein isoform X2 n=1 Tax=Alligator mississippiensis TaxID=8496 RepID=UPI002877BD74|nr:Fanconi anemia group A protein isoform X2 [Alligator mississippiensis]